MTAAFSSRVGQLFDNDDGCSPIKARAEAAASVPLYLISSALDAIAGVLLGSCEILRCRFREASEGWVYLDAGKKGMKGAAENLIRVLNPRAKCKAMTLDPMHIISICLSEAAGDCSSGENFWKKHAASRSLAALATIAFTVELVVKALIGIAALPLALLTCGKFEQLNCLACDGVTAPADLVHGLLKALDFMIHLK